MKTLSPTCSRSPLQRRSNLPPAEKPAHFSALVPFSGFYDSHHSARIDDVEERMFHDDQGNIAHESLCTTFWTGVDNRKVFELYAEHYVQALAQESGIAMEFEEMVSPRWYNFETDRLFAKIGRSDLALMLRAVRGQRLNTLTLETFTSRPGFTSRYPNSIRLWGRIADWDHNQVGTVLAAYINQLRQEGNLRSEEDLADEHITDESIEVWLCEAANKAATRALTISDYLRRRSERRHGSTVR